MSLKNDTGGTESNPEGAREARDLGRPFERTDPVSVLFCCADFVRFNATAVGEGLAPPAVETMRHFIRYSGRRGSEAARGS